MKRLIFLCYLIISVEMAYGQGSERRPEIDIEEIGKNEGLFYEYFQGKTQFEIKTSSKKIFRINTGAGKVKIKPGKKNRIQVQAEILILASNYKKAVKYLERDLELRLEDKGRYVELVSNFNYQKETRRGDTFNPFDFVKTPDRKVNLVISVPEKMDLEITDNSGDLDLLGLHNNMTIEDGSGYIKIKNSNGNINIRDRSGNIYLSNINEKGGDHHINIDDQSGSIEISHVSGDLKLEDDSGDIYVQDVKGDIFIDDYSGELKLRDITGNIDIEDTSGDISTKRITGSATYYDGAGDIYISEISADVHVKDAGAGDVYYRNVNGKISGDIDN